MSLLVLGLSHRTAPIEVLERAALDAAGARALGLDLRAAAHVAEVAVLSTCNRVEVYAEVNRFHGGVVDLATALAARSGLQLDSVADHLYVHYDEHAVEHLFSVACGLDSMALGEQQILGQLRQALRTGQENATVGRSLGTLLEQALRVGKRAHTETGLDRAGHSLVTAALDAAAAGIDVDMPEAAALVVGAGAMSALVAHTMARRPVAEISVVNRTADRAVRLAASVGGRAAPLADLAAEIARADVVVSCTGSVGFVVTEHVVRRAMATRRRAGPLVLVDLALPRDVEPQAGELAGVRLFDLAWLGTALADAETGSDIRLVREMVVEEVREWAAALRAQSVAPTVVALRSAARTVMEAELVRLAQRLPDLDPATQAELRQTVHRVVDKLLHTPTVRIKELAEAPGGAAYAEALRRLFDLDVDSGATRLSEVPRLSGTVAEAIGGLR